MSKLLNWSEVSRSLKVDRTRLNPDYSGKMYKEVIHDIKEIEKLIELRIKAFNESRSIDKAIIEDDVMNLQDKVKEITE